MSLISILHSVIYFSLLGTALISSIFLFLSYAFLSTPQNRRLLIVLLQGENIAAYIAFLEYFFGVQILLLLAFFFL